MHHARHARGPWVCGRGCAQRVESRFRFTLLSSCDSRSCDTWRTSQRANSVAVLKPVAYTDGRV